jgi:steroid delta-isomerase
MTDRARLVSTCDRYLAAVASGDPDAVLELFGDQPRIEDPVGSEPRIGREPVREFYAQNSGVEMRLHRIGPVTVVGSRAAFQFRIEVPLGEDTLVMASTDVMTFDEDGRILTMTAYPDAEADPDMDDSGE